MMFIRNETSVCAKQKESVITKSAWWKGIHGTVARVLKKPPRNLKSVCDITVVLIGDAKMKELHTAYTGTKKVTDVLSFFYGRAEGERRPQGEVFICLPQALRQARRYRVPSAHEIARLAVHGFLHVYGYDHQKRGERAVMRALERDILNLCEKEHFF